MSIESQLIDNEEKALVDYILTIIPAADRKGLSEDDVLLVLDLMDDYLIQAGLAQLNDQTEEIEYLDGDVDETEQLQFVLNEAQKQGVHLSSAQVQLIQDAELQYGIEHGYYAEDDE